MLPFSQSKTRSSEPRRPRRRPLAALAGVALAALLALPATTPRGASAASYARFLDAQIVQVNGVGATSVVGIAIQPNNTSTVVSATQAQTGNYIAPLIAASTTGVEVVFLYDFSTNTPSIIDYYILYGFGID